MLVDSGKGADLLVDVLSNFHSLRMPAEAQMMDCPGLKETSMSLSVILWDVPHCPLGQAEPD